MNDNVKVREDVHAFWVAAPGRGELRREAIGHPASGEVLVRTLYSGVSRGTESLVFHGHVPESEWDRMRAPFQQGGFPAPVKYGYANVGVVDEGPDDLIGRTVFALYPHQTRYIVPAAAVQIVPEQVPPGRAVLAANLETAVNGVWDARPHVGDRIAVIGAGTVGCLAAWLAAQIAGCDVELIDINQDRADIAAALRVRFASPEAARPDADVVIHASGTPDGLRTALAVAGREAVITELSWFGTREVALPLGSAFHSHRLTIASSQVGTIPAAQRARWTHGRRLQLALRLLADASLDALITGESAFDALPETFPRVLDDRATLCHRIRYV